MAHKRPTNRRLVTRSMSPRDNHEAACLSRSRQAETTEFESCIRRGLEFCRTHFFRDDVGQCLIGALGVPMGHGSHVGRSGLLLLSSASLLHNLDLVCELVSGLDVPGNFHATGDIERSREESTGPQLKALV